MARRVAVFGLVLAMMALIPASFFKTHHAARYDYIPTIGSSLVWAAVVSVVIAGTRLPRFLSVTIVLLILLTIPAQVHRLNRRLEFWHEQGDHGIAFMNAIQKASPLFREINGKDTIYLIDSPIDLIQLRCMISLVYDLKPLQIKKISQDDISKIDGQEHNLVLRWDPTTSTFDQVLIPSSISTATGAKMRTGSQGGRAGERLSMLRSMLLQKNVNT